MSSGKFARQAPVMQRELSLKLVRSVSCQASSPRRLRLWTGKQRCWLQAAISTI